VNGFENGETQLFNSGGVVKFPKKKKRLSIPLSWQFQSIQAWSVAIMMNRGSLEAWLNADVSERGIPEVTSLPLAT